MTYNIGPKTVDNTDVGVALATPIPVSLSKGYGTTEYRYENKLDYMPNVSQCKRICERNDNPAKSKINLTKTDDIIIAVISEIIVEINVRNWVVKSGATRHICINKNNFISYTQVEKEE